MSQGQIPSNGRRTTKGASIGPPGAKAGVGSNDTLEPNLPYGAQGTDDLGPELQALIQQRQNEAKKVEWNGWVEDRFTECKTARQQFERQWFINLAFERGRQYIQPAIIPGYGFRLSTPRAPRHRVRLVINKVRKAVRTECSKLTSSRPIPTVVPATNEREDLGAAIIAEQILKAAFNTADFEETYRMGVWWSTVCGTGFLKMYWDKDCDDYEAMSLPDPPVFPPQAGQLAGQPLPDEIIDRIPGMRERLNQPIPAKGKIIIDKINPFCIYIPDLMSDRLESQPFLIHTLTKSPRWVEDHFGFKPTPDAMSAATTLDISMIIAKGSEMRFDSVLVKEVWIKPGAHKDFPQGGMLTVINNAVRQCVEEWPLPYPDFPFYKLNAIPTGGFYSDSIVVDLIPLQKEYNKTRSKATEIKNVMGVPRLIYPEGSINPRKITTEVGQSIPYTPGFDQPTVLQATEVPQSYINEVQQLASEFDDISNQHDLTQNGDPASGTAMAFLQEQDDMLLVYQTSSIEYAMQKIGAHYLRLVSQFWEDDRVIKVTGRNKSYEAVHWKKGSLRGNTDVRIQTGSALPVSKAARTAMITEMMQNGFISPEAGLEILDMGDMDRMMDEYLTDKNQAMRENLKMQELPPKLLALAMQPHPGPNGEPPFELPPDPTNPDPQAEPTQMNGDGTPFQPQPPIPVNSYDNNDAHIKWHDQFRKTEEFELLDEAHKQAFELHVQMHHMAVQAAQVNMGGQIVQPGMGGAPGGGNPMGGPGGDPGMDPTAPPSGGGPLGQQSQDPQFAEDPANLDAATARARAVDARTGTGQFKG